MDDDDLYGDLEGDDGLDLYGGLEDTAAVQKDASTVANPLPDEIVPQQQQQQQPVADQTKKQTESGKIFVGGLNWETTEASLLAYFEKYGTITDSVIMRDTLSSKSRGFGFVTFADGRVVDGVLCLEHVIDGKTVDPKRAVPKGDTEKCEKIFVGGISPDVSETEFSDFFSQFGGVLDSILMLDRDTGRPRGFGFITFESSDCVDRVLDRQGTLFIKEKLVEVKRAQPKGAPGLAPIPRANVGYNPRPGMMGAGNMGGGMPMMPNMMMPNMMMMGAMNMPMLPNADGDDFNNNPAGGNFNNNQQFGYYNPAMMRPMMGGGGMMGGGFMPMMGGAGFRPGFQQGFQRGVYGGGPRGGFQRGGYGGGGYQQDDGSDGGRERGKRHHPYKGGR